MEVLMERPYAEADPAPSARTARLSKISAKVTVPDIRARKSSDQKLVMLTAYDAPSARAVDESGADLILVGDSVGMVVLGYENTLRVTLDEMLYHAGAVTRTKPRALVVVDMPYLSYHTGARDAVIAAGRLVQIGGAEAVKLEGGIKRVDVVRALVDAEIPVMGHLGLTPQSMLAMGGYRVQGRQLEEIERMFDDARALVAAGVFAIVLEGIPDRVASALTESIEVPTIGIGAGSGCDGQVLVFHDLLGIHPGPAPRFVRHYAQLHDKTVGALQAFGDDVRAGRFPAASESYRLKPEVEAAWRAAHDARRRRG
jgi:3-methyl-2-oxobutanoate hydroxymethyltransferase